MSNEVVYDESVKIRDFALENGQKSSVSPFKGQLLYDIDSNKVCYGKYNSKTQEVEWADLNMAVTPIKYAELKALRDSGQLVPNIRYRITDYVTATTQEHTSSAGHTFDIVVTANTPSELSENAQARIHGGTDGGGEDGYHFIISDYNGVEVAYRVFVDEYTSETFGDYPDPDVAPARLSYDGDGIPIIYFNDGGFPNGLVDEYTDYMKYNGRYTYDGALYDSWVQYNSSGGSYSEQDGYDNGDSVDWNRVYVLTNVIVAGGAPSGGDDEEEEHRITIKYKMFVDGDVLEDMYERPGGGRHNEIDFAMYNEVGEPRIYLNDALHKGAIGGADFLYYQGRYTYNGTEYDKWLLYNSHNTDDENNYTYYYDGIGFTGGQTVMLTNIVTDGNGHFADWVEVRNDVYPMDIRLITPQFKIYIDESSEVTEYGDDEPKLFKKMDFTGYKNGTPVIYVNEPWHKGCANHADYLLYDGAYEYNGTEYDKWVQYHCNGNDYTTTEYIWDETVQDNIPSTVVLLTNKVITGDGKFRGDVTNATFEIIDDVDTMLYVDIDEGGDADGYNDGHLPAEIYSLVLGDDGRPRLYVNDDEYLGEQDTDYYIYMGRYDYNGTEYDSWAKYSPADHCYYIRGMRLLTNIVIETTYVEPTPVGTKFDSWVLCDENGDEIHTNIRLLTNKVIGVNVATPVGDDPTYSIIDNDVELKYMVHTDNDSLYANGMDVDIENMVVAYKMFIDEDSFNIHSYIQSSPSKPVPAGISLLNGEIIVHINNVGFDGVVNRYSDYMKYNGRYTYNGVEYDSWIEYISNRTTNLEEYSSTLRCGEDTVRIMVLTNIVVTKKPLLAEVYSFALDNDGIPRLYLNKEGYEGEPNTDYWRYAGEYWYDDGNGEEDSEDIHDPWFDYNNLNAWTLKYSLDNDTDRFAWADTENGKGVIYFMRDEFGNEAPYDFKNIMYDSYGLWLNSGYHYLQGYGVLNYYHIRRLLPYGLANKVVAQGIATLEDYTYMYTFSACLVFREESSNVYYDATLNNNEYILTRNNVIKECYDSNGKMVLPDIVFYWEKCCGGDDSVSSKGVYGRLNYGDAPHNCSFNVVEGNCHDIRLPLNCHYCTVMLGSHDLLGTADERYNIPTNYGASTNVAYGNKYETGGYSVYYGARPLDISFIVNYTPQIDEYYF